MWITIERRRPGAPPVELVEIVTPRTNTATITSAENFLAAIALAEPFSLEIAATNRMRWFLARAGSATMRAHVESQLAVAYPQAKLRPLDHDRFPGLDPARPGPEEQVAIATLVLRGPAYLPLRTFRDGEIAPGSGDDPDTQADPVLGILSALGDLPDGWRALAQLLLQPAPDDWCKGFLRLAIEHPLEAEHAARASAYAADTSQTPILFLVALLVGGAGLVQGYHWYQGGDWRDLAVLIGIPLVGITAILWLVRRLGDHPLYDPKLVQEKIRRPAYQCEIRLAVFAPSDALPSAVRARLERLAAAYRPFTLASGNGLVLRRSGLRDRDLRVLAARSGPRALLNTRELAGLWHLPRASADVLFLERTGARQRLPLPATVADGCRIGVSVRQSQRVPVALPDALLRRHLLLVAKTGRGKSSLLVRLFQYLATQRASDGRPPALVLVDPHRDLARAGLGLVPPERRDAVVVLDVAEQERPFGLNLLDTGLGWERDKAVANVLTVFRRQFDEFWGPRMEDAFRFAALSLFEANQALCAPDPVGRLRQHTILAVPALLTIPAFRRSVLAQVSDPHVKAWWSDYYDPLDRRFQLEIANPVQTKVQRFVGSRAARSIVGQPRSTVDPAAWLKEGKIVVVHTAKGMAGEDTAALIGATILNLIALVTSEQAALPPEQRRPVNVLVDELHTMPGADYETYLAELAKYGASMTLATQSLKRLDALDREQHRALRATLFANVDGLFAFQVSAEDAQYLARELGGDVDAEDLLTLDDYQCYARISVRRERLPVFSLDLDPPPTSDEDLADELAARSARQYGRHRTAVERDLQAALDRIAQCQRPPADPGEPGQGGAGVLRDHRPPSDGGSAGARATSKGRNNNREKKPPKELEQPRLFVEEALTGGSVDGALSGEQDVGENGEVGDREGDVQ